jgi:hypothetical protein
MTPLRSVRSKGSRPQGLAQVQISRDQRVFIETEALEIFTQMVNGGATLQQTLAAVFLSGMNAAKEALK